MARQQSRAQRQTVSRVMHEFKHGQLKRSRGGKVKDRKQAIAIGLREAGGSKYESPQENRRSLRQTKRKERTGRTAAQTAEKRRPRSRSRTRAELYAEAKRRNIRGRSKMNKAALERALHG